MRINKEGLDLIKEFEGLKLKAYLDVVGVPTIGYGCTNGVSKEDVANGRTITEAEAEAFLLKELVQFEQGVPKYVTVPLNENEFSALVSFSYNLGLGSLQKSTLLQMLNSGDRSGAAAQFLRWNKAGGKEYAGLTRRRQAEKDLFEKSIDRGTNNLLPDGPSDQDVNVKLEDIEKEILK